ncbi:MAG: aminopeptidase [Gaiellaceae bacterium]
MEGAVERLAELIVGVGANVQAGQTVAVTAELEAAPLVQAIAAAAYRRGALFVDPFYVDARVKRARLQLADEETLSHVPRWYGARQIALGDDHAARITIVPTIPPGLLDDVDPARAGKDGLPAIKESFPIINARTTNWCVAPYPTPSWAAAAYPGVEPGAALERLWHEVMHVCRLDEPDPIAAWKERFAALAAVAARLTERRFDAIHFEGPGTDLTIGLFASSRWEGGFATTVDGVVHAANIPSEEITSAPDPLRADGVVTATKPLDIAGTVVRGLRVRFEGGRAVQIDADENVDMLRSRCARDDEASRLGEIALVDGEGRIGPLGTSFCTTLLDENAASHLAFGNAYLSQIEAPEDLARANSSSIHLDFMIGSPEVDVTGVTREGERVPVLRGGAWQL